MFYIGDRNNLLYNTKRYKFSKMRRSEALQQLAKASEVDTENSENELVFKEKETK